MKTRFVTVLFFLGFFSSPVVGETSGSLTNADWSSIRAAYEAERHEFSRQLDGTHTAVNPRQGWSLRFDKRGFQVRPQSGDWTWGLECLMDDAESGPLSIMAEGNRLTRRWSASLEEWYVNDSRGLEQGWTLHDARAEGVRLRVRGGLAVEVGRTNVNFGGQLNYGGLKAWDATGRDLQVWFEAGEVKDEFVVRYETAGAVYPVTIDPVAEMAVLLPQVDGYHRFGSSVAVSGSFAVVGASMMTQNPSGGGDDSSALLEAGAAYVFVRDGDTWTLHAELVPSEIVAWSRFGGSVAIDGDTIVVAAASLYNDAPDDFPDIVESPGAVYVFVRRGSEWREQARLTARHPLPADIFGRSVALSGDWLVVGTTRDSSAARGINGNELDTSAPASGAAHVFQRSGSRWERQAYLKASNAREDSHFGSSVALSGNTVVVGALTESSGARGVNGDQTDTSAPYSGAAYVFTRSGSRWAQQAYLKASNTDEDDQFGVAVTISGDTLAVGADGERSAAQGVNGDQSNNSLQYAGAAYVFVREGGSWSQQVYLKASNPGVFGQFGISLSLSGDLLVVGAPGDSSSGTGVNGNQHGSPPIHGSGAAYLFQRSGVNWRQTDYLKASNSSDHIFFGQRVAIDRGTLFSSAPESGESLAARPGAVYVFHTQPSLVLHADAQQQVLGGVLGRRPAPPLLNPSGRPAFLLDIRSADSGRFQRAMFSTLSGGLEVLMQQREVFEQGFAGLPAGSRVSRIDHPISNSIWAALFEFTATGRGLNGFNNRLLMSHDGVSIWPVLQTGQALTQLGDAQVARFSPVLQMWGGVDLIALNYQLRNGVANVNRANNSGLLQLDRYGSITQSAVRAGNTALGPSPGLFGRIGHATLNALGNQHFLAHRIVEGEAPRQAVYYESGRSLQAGDVAPATTQGERFRVFTGITGGQSNTSVVRATLSGSATALNEGVWNESSNHLLLRKGDSIDGGPQVARIERVWGLHNSGQLLALVRLRGAGVNASNRRAVILRQANGKLTPLMRTGQSAPGLGFNSIKVRAIQAVEVDPGSGHYAILASLRGVPGSANQALWSGSTALGNDGDDQDLRLPRLRLQKGQDHHTDAGARGRIRSITLRNADDRTGVGGRGLGQALNSFGEASLILTGDNGPGVVVLSP